MSALDAIDWDDARINPQGQADTREEPKWYQFNWDATKASAEQAYWDTPGRAQDTRNSDILSAAAALTELNGRSITRYQIIPMGEPGGVPIANETQFWRDLAELRRTRPDALTDFAKDKEDYDARLTQRFQRGTAQRAQRMAQGGVLGNLAGGIAGSFTDPINVATLPLGGWGRSAAMKILTEGAVQAGVQTLETPALAIERQQQGGELTAAEAGWNIALAGLGGAAFKGAELGIGKVGSKALEATADARSALALRLARPEVGLSPEQMAAVHVLNRAAEVDETNPFANTYEGLDAHEKRLTDTIAAMGRWPEAQAVQALRPAVRPTQPLGAPLSADFDTAWRAIIGNEGGTNRDGSFRTSPAGAIGPAQVMPSTAPEAARLAGLPWDEARYRSDHAYNVALGQAYYRDLLRQFDGDPVKAAAAYNAGPGSARRGTGLRGAMERARRAGVPDEWVSFLPAETRKYVFDFRRRTSMGAGDTIDAGGDFARMDADAAPVRSPDLDAERPMVDAPDRADLDGLQDRAANDLPDLGEDLPTLRRDLFGSDEEWRAAQAAVDADAMGSLPVQSTRPVADLPELAAARAAEGGPAQASIEVPERPTAEIRSNVAADAVDDVMLGPIFTSAKGEPGVRVESVPGGSLKDDLLVAVYRDENGAPKGALYFPATEAGVRFNQEGGYGLSVYVDPAFRRQGVATKLYDEAAKVAPWVNRMSGSGDLTPAGASFSRARRELLQSRAPAEHAPAMRDELEAAQAAGPVVPDVEAGKVFDEPGSDAIGRAADLAWHDAQIAASARAENGLTFDLGDGKGERSFADIEAELKADEDAISTIEGCLAPAPLGAAA